MITKISPQHRCPTCNIRYQRKHTCPGRGHRKAKCSSGLGATEIHNIKGRRAFLNSEVSSTIHSSTPSSKQPLAASNTTSHRYHRGQLVLWRESSLNTAITPSDGGPLLGSALYSYPPDPLSYTEVDQEIQYIQTASSLAFPTTRASSSETDETCLSTISRASLKRSQSLSPLILEVDDKTRYINFFSCIFITSRTLVTSNIFADMILLSEGHEHLRLTIYAIGAWYLNQWNSSLQYQTQCLGNLRAVISTASITPHVLKVVLSTQVLLLQLAVISPSSYNDWCSMIKGHGSLLQHSMRYPETLAYRMRLAAHHVLANTIEQEMNAFPNWTFLSREEETIIEIDAMIATSPELLNIFQSITLLSFTDPDNYEKAESIAERLRNLQQICSDTRISTQRRQVMQNTAETYRLGALMYLCWRFPCLLEEREIQIIQRDLLESFLSLPLDGPLYKSTHPLWSLFFLCISQVKDERLASAVEQLSNMPATNIGPALNLGRQAWEENLDWRAVSELNRNRISLT